MVTERKAFDSQDVQSLRDCILDSAPVAPIQLNAKVHPLLSDLIMKALAKDPALRYQTGRQLLDDLENCKEARPAAAKKPEAPKKVAAPVQTQAAAQAKFVTPAAPAPVQKKAAAPAPIAPAGVAGLAKPVSKLATPKSAAAAAGIGGGTVASVASLHQRSSVAGEATIESSEALSS